MAFAWTALIDRSFSTVYKRHACIWWFVHTLYPTAIVDGFCDLADIANANAD